MVTSITMLIRVPYLNALGITIISFKCHEKSERKKLQTTIGEITFGGGIFNVVSLKYIGKCHLVITYTLKERNNINELDNKIFTKSLGAWPRGPLATPLGGVIGTRPNN